MTVSFYMPAVFVLIGGVLGVLTGGISAIAGFGKSDMLSSFGFLLFAVGIIVIPTSVGMQITAWI